MAHSQSGLKLSKADIKFLIEREAIAQGFDPELAVAVAEVESSLNPHARGSRGEIGLFQLMPHIAAHMNDPGVEKQIKEAIRQLKYWQQACPVQENNTFVICYNSGYRRPRYPLLHPYYKKVVEAMNAHR